MKMINNIIAKMLTVSPRKILLERIFETESQIKEIDRKPYKTIEDMLILDDTIAARLEMVARLRRYDELHQKKMKALAN